MHISCTSTLLINGRKKMFGTCVSACRVFTAVRPNIGIKLPPFNMEWSVTHNENNKLKDSDSVRNSH